jgi:short-subunit dehydrogenase
MKDIGGRVAVVTGASRGLGRAIAETLFDHGMKVVVAARSGEELESFLSRLDRSGTRTLAVAGDVTAAADRERLVEAARQKFGNIDVLVNNAGTDHPEFFAGADFARVEEMVGLNLVALMAMTQAVLPEMLRQRSGQVVNIASVAGLAPVPYGAVYAATKAAVINFSQSLRYEVADQGVGVSVVCPYYVRDAGLYHVNSEGDGEVATVSPDDVGDAVVSAITGNRPRVIASPLTVKLTPFLTAVSPGLTNFAARTTGAGKVMEKMADNLRRREARGTEPVAARAEAGSAVRTVASAAAGSTKAPASKKPAPRRARAPKAG